MSAPNESFEPEPGFRAMGHRLINTVITQEKNSRRHRRITMAIGIAAAVSVVATGAFFAVASDYQRRYTVDCFEGTTLHSRSVSSNMAPSEDGQKTSRVKLAENSCAATWRYGILGQPRGTELNANYPVPALTICENQWGLLSAFPTSRDRFCESVGLHQPQE